jgi:hypothetical protein
MPRPFPGVGRDSSAALAPSREPRRRQKLLYHHSHDPARTSSQESLERPFRLPEASFPARKGVEGESEAHPGLPAILFKGRDRDRARPSHQSARPTRKPPVSWTACQSRFLLPLPWQSIRGLGRHSVHGASSPSARDRVEDERDEKGRSSPEDARPLDRGGPVGKILTLSTG